MGRDCGAAGATAGSVSPPGARGHHGPPGDAEHADERRGPRLLRSQSGAHPFAGAPEYDDAAAVIGAEEPSTRRHAGDLDPSDDDAAAATGAEEPRTWRELQGVLAAAHVLFGATRTGAAQRALEDFHGVLMRIPHEGCRDPSSLCRRLRDKSEICPSRMRAWVAAAIGTAAGDSASLPSASLFRRPDDLLLDLREVEALAHRNRRSWSPTLGADLQQAARRAVSVAIDRKAALCRSRRPRRAGSGDVPDLDRVASWLSDHPKVHRMDHASFVYERIDTICEVLDRTLDRGAHAPLAAMASAAAPHLMVLERTAILRRLAEAVSMTSADGTRTCTALWALTDLVGAHLYKDGDLDQLGHAVLNDDVKRCIEDQAHGVEAHARDTAMASKSRALRPILLAVAAFERLRGLTAHRAGADLHVVLHHLSRAKAHALDASHETLQVALVADESVVRRAHGQTAEAIASLARALVIARGHRNHRMRFVLHREAAYTCAQHGAPLLALEHASLAHETLDIIDDLCEIQVQGRTRPGWYQPSFRAELKRLYADLEGAGVAVEALQASHPAAAESRRPEAPTDGSRRSQLNR